MDLSIEDYPQLLSNIADILSSDPILGATLLVSQNVDLDLFVYHLLDNYNDYEVIGLFRYRLKYGLNYYIFGTTHTSKSGYYSYNYPTSDEVDGYIYKELIKLIKHL